MGYAPPPGMLPSGPSQAPPPTREAGLPPAGPPPPAYVQPQYEPPPQAQPWQQPPPPQPMQPWQQPPPPQAQPWQQPPPPQPMQPWQQPPQPQAPAAASGQAVEFPLHGGAKGAYVLVGVLLILLVVTIPFAIWVFIGSGRARIRIAGNEFHARGVFLGNRWNLSSLRRLGVLAVSMSHARGLGGAIARKKVGGDHAVHLCAIDDRGKKMNFLVSMYERHQDIINTVAGITGLPLEQVQQGALGPKWAEQK